jgi:hypothetical protein
VSLGDAICLTLMLAQVVAQIVVVVRCFRFAGSQARRISDQRYLDRKSAVERDARR